jgi:6-pyruvoyltetrahydropterin/6-carboxytetrahydropterin synthase
MYETGLSVSVRGFHVMPGLPPPEGQLHSHDYRLDVVVRRAELDDAQMVVDLDLLDRSLAEVTGSISERNLDEIVAPTMGTEAVTVEVFARWAHDRLSEALGQSPETFIAVRVWESPVAFGGYEGPVGG